MSQLLIREENKGRRTPKPSPERVKEQLAYDPNTGIVTWKVNKGSRIKVGDNAGYVSTDGYYRVQVDNVMLLSHIVAWLLYYGNWPPSHLDHVNRVRHDNRIENLRLATRSQNMANRTSRKGSSSRFKGVYWSTRDRRWIAEVRKDNKRVFQMHCKDEEQAAREYDRVAKQTFGEYAVVNFNE